MQSTGRNHNASTLCRVYLLETTATLKSFPNCEFTSLLSTHLPTHLGAVYLKEDFGPKGEVSLEQMEGSFLGGLSSGDVDFLYLSRDVFSFFLLKPSCATSISQTL